LRSFRVVRAARILHTLKFVPALRLMVASITCSIGSLFWAGVMMVMILFVWAMGIQQLIQSTLESRGMHDQHPRLMELYGTLPSTMLSLFMAISGGDWKKLAEPLEYLSRFYTGLYVVFVSMTLFGMLNILTAVFVEATTKVSKVDSDLVIQDALEQEKDMIGQLKDLFIEADVDNNGCLSQEEFETKLEDSRFRAQMKLLDLNIFEAQGLFQLLDVEDTNEVEIDNIVYGLMCLKGSAKAVDMATMIYDNKRLLSKLANFAKLTDSNFQELREAITSSTAVGDLPLTATTMNMPAQRALRGRPCA